MEYALTTRTINVCSVHLDPLWLRFFPDSIPQWGEWCFLLNADKENYDYLVVYDDLPHPIKPLCPEQNTIHIATEPPLGDIGLYPEDYRAQFAWHTGLGKTTSQAGEIPHCGGHAWWVGKDFSMPMDLHQVATLFEHPKSKLLSVIASQHKNHSDPHRVRFQFAQRLKAHYGERLDFYGRGFAPVQDKLEALGAYRFHIALENTSSEHYFTEKLNDCILTGTYPVYYGCPNLNQYFPENAFLSIDIHDFDRAVTLIDHAILHAFDQKYRAELLQARDLVLYEYNIPPMLITLIERIERGEYGDGNVPLLHRKRILPYLPRESRREAMYRYIKASIKKLLLPPPPPPPLVRP